MKHLVTAHAAGVSIAGIAGVGIVSANTPSLLNKEPCGRGRHKAVNTERASLLLGASARQRRHHGLIGIAGNNPTFGGSDIKRALYGGSDVRGGSD